MTTGSRKDWNKLSKEPTQLKDIRNEMMEFDYTEGYPSEGPPRVILERCSERDLTAWSITRREGRKLREMWKWKEVRHKDGEIQSLCLENVCDVLQSGDER